MILSSKDALAPADRGLLALTLLKPKSMTARTSFSRFAASAVFISAAFFLLGIFVVQPRAAWAEPISRPVREAPYRAATAIYYDQLSFINPLFQSGYRGAERRPLARFDGQVVDEFDLYSFLAMARHPTPRLYELYLKERTPAGRVALAKELRDALRVYVLIHRLAREAEDADFDLTPIEEREAEILALTGYMMAWTEGVLEPQARVSDRDALREHRAHPFDSYRPAEARVRVILRRFQAPEPPRPRRAGSVASGRAL
jgi:hypothetical protein